MILGENWTDQLNANAETLGMTTTMLADGGKAPEELDANRAFHKDLVERMASAIKVLGWPGAQFCFYQRREGYVYVYAAPHANGELTLNGLSYHREAQKRATEALPAQPALFA